MFTASPLQIDAGVVSVAKTVGFGVTVIVAVPIALVQPFAMAEIVKVVTCVVLVVLVNVPLMLEPDGVKLPVTLALLPLLML